MPLSLETISTPVLILGGGSGALGAALQCARSGTKCLLVTPGAWVGGMLSASGVSAPDGNELSPWQTGLWGALLRQLRQQVPQGLDQNWVSCFGFQPGQAEAIFQGWLAAEPNLQWRSGMTLEKLNRLGNRLVEAIFSDSSAQVQVKFDLIVDGTELAESLALAGIKHRFGWEPKEQWNEPSAPTLQELKQDPFFIAQPVQSPTWVVFGKWNGSLVGNQYIPKSKQANPPFNDCLNPHGLFRTLSYGHLPEDWLMLNWPKAGNDWHQDPGAPFSGSNVRITEHRASMQNHSLDFLNELQVISNGLLQPANAFPSNLAGGCLALQAYWRESRRLIGACTVIEQDLLPNQKNRLKAKNSIAVGNYPNDHHYPGADWPLAPKSIPWGGRWSGTPFCIPYECLYGAEISNLLMADKGISVSHIANGATRLGPLILNVGQAAGVAAALCFQGGVLPADLEVRQVQRDLINDQKAPLGPFILEDLPWHSPDWRDQQMAALNENPQICIPMAPPLEPGEQAQLMELNIKAEDQWFGYWDGMEWPLISLEPVVKMQMANLHGKRITALGRWNPWGPWWRINQLLP